MSRETLLEETRTKFFDAKWVNHEEWGAYRNAGGWSIFAADDEGYLIVKQVRQHVPEKHRESILTDEASLRAKAAAKKAINGWDFAMDGRRFTNATKEDAERIRRRYANAT